MKKELNPAITISIVVVIVLIVGYFLFMRSDTGSVSGEVAHKNAAKQETNGPSDK